MKEKMICRGDLFYYDFGDNSGSVQSGERPVLVVQADDYNQNAPTIIVAAVTSVIKKRYLPSHIILGEEFGLKKPSMVLLEQIRTVNREDLREYIGTVDDDKLFRQINATLKKTFGLWVYKPEGRENIRCLCPKCLNDYIHNPDYIVRRLDPFAKRKDRCDNIRLCIKPRLTCTGAAAHKRIQISSVLLGIKPNAHILSHQLIF